MRIISGTYGGRKILAPAGNQTRPTLDRVREALFSTLFDVKGFRVLDLFAGSGAVGLEALSRGAAWVDFVEQGKAAARTLRENIENLQVPTQKFAVHSTSAETALRRLSETRYDLVYLDPPYRASDASIVGWFQEAHQRLSDTGTLILETDREELPEALPPSERIQRYGSTRLATWKA